jgi:cytochrome c oxidase subunit IV
VTDQTTTPDIAPTDAMPVPQSAAEDEHAHAGVHDANLHHSPEEIRREMRVYLVVFAGLAVLTAATVAARTFLNLPAGPTVAVALVIASIKGSLVAGFFMHLLSEKKVIYGVLILTAVFFAVLLFLPVHDILGKFGHY